VQLEYVSLPDTVDQFDTESVAAFETAYEQLKQRGMKVKALLICNPNNPLGQWISHADSSSNHLSGL
jgi:1-aminocyclopropane-1-carboxylate synthase